MNIEVVENIDKKNRVLHRLVLASGKENIPAALAPLAGYSDLPFRKICKREGAFLLTTELVSATGIRFSGIEKSRRYLEIDADAEKNVLIQLFGADVDDFKYAVEAILQDAILSRCTGIDINMGCPVPKVVKTGAGSGLMAHPEKATKIIKELAPVLHAEGYLLSAKMRRGFKGEIETSAGLAVDLAVAGCDLITVHGRFREQYYAGKADWGCIRRVNEALREQGLRDQIALLANGDIDSYRVARSAIDQTGADAVSIGRAAQGNPWIFREFSSENRGPVETNEKAGVILEHAKELIAFLGELQAMREFRKTLAAYATGHPMARKLRGLGSGIESLEDVERWLQAFMEETV